MKIQINKKISKDEVDFALFNLGFRPFFLGASIFAVVSITLWMIVYFTQIKLSITQISISQWHAHEMIYGYGMAVVAGFLLTAVKNWTGIQTIKGNPLIVLFVLWCTARLLFLFGTKYLLWAAMADLMFGLMLIIAITIPIVKAKQWLQLAVVTKVLILWVGNLVFYLGCYNVLKNWMTFAISGAVLLFISLILMIGRRVIPFFIERGVNSKVQLKQYKWLDISILIVFVALFINVIFVQLSNLTTAFSLILFVLNSYRLCNWHNVGIWRVPLLWSLYISAWLIDVGFLLFGLQASGFQAQYSNLTILTLHIFTIGGMGLTTMGMMARVALGHTGRDIRKPSRWMGVAFSLIVASAVFRSLIPLITTDLYKYWIMIAAVFWILGFSVFVVIYTPVLLKKRVDGAFG